jgi:hypothetical protein
VLAEVNVILSPFRIIQTFFESSSVPTISSFPFMVYVMRSELKKAIEANENNPPILELLNAMNHTFIERFGTGTDDSILQDHKYTSSGKIKYGLPKLSILACFVDPCYKMKGIPRGVQNEAYDMLECELLSMMEKKNNSSSNESSVNNNEISSNVIVAPNVIPSKKSKNTVLLNSLVSEYGNVFDEGISVNIVLPTTVNLKITIKKEVDQWKQLKLNENVDCLSFWKHNCKTYPIISQFARQVLCIPASSAASERVFSSAGNTISDKRNRLNADVVRDIIFLKDSISKVPYHQSQRKSKVHI